MAEVAEGRIVDARYFENSRRADGSRMYYEVLFPGVFTQKHPGGKNPEDEWADWRVQKLVKELKRPLRFLQDLSIPLQNLSHITHKRNSDEIQCDPSCCVFKPKEKTGKSYKEDGSPLGESYDALSDGRYQHFLPGRQVLPGYYCWWGVHNVTQIRVDVKEEIKKLQDHKAHVVEYLKIRPVSRYGDHEFYGSFTNVLCCYRESRCCSDIHLKVGGTLRYRNEICYVIIVCTENDLKALKRFSPVNQRESHPFDPNGLVDHDGRITNPEAVPIFRPKHTVTVCNIPQVHFFSWENIAFAFYYPTQEDQYLICHSSMVSHRLIYHPEAKCISKQPVLKPDGTKDWVCPNNLSSQPSKS